MLAAALALSTARGLTGLGSGDERPVSVGCSHINALKARVLQERLQFIRAPLASFGPNQHVQVHQPIGQWASILSDQLLVDEQGSPGGEGLESAAYEAHGFFIAPVVQDLRKENRIEVSGPAVGEEVSFQGADLFAESLFLGAFFDVGQDRGDL